MTVRILRGHVLDRLRELPDESVHCCVTSPPYYGLRDYGVPGQFGLEPTLAEYLDNMVAVFREVRRVLRSDGTLWLNIGDSYAANRGYQVPHGEIRGSDAARDAGAIGGRGMKAETDGFKVKDLMGVPWKLAMALQQPYYTGRIKSEADRAWLAGFLDGEGTISFVERDRGPDHTSTHDVAVYLTNCDRAPLDSFAGVSGGRVYVHDDGTRENRFGTRPVFRWKLGTHDSALLIRELYPYLRTKKKQAALVWSLYTTLRHKNGHARTPDDVVARRRAIADLVRAANRGEPIDVPEWIEEPPVCTEPGWYLRSDIIWSKKSCMPESVRDRPTKSHEHIFLLAKSESYYYDQVAASEPVEADTIPRYYRGRSDDHKNADGGPGDQTINRSFAHMVGLGHNERERKAMPNVKRSGNKERKPASARGVPVDTGGNTNGAVAGSTPWEGSTRNWRDVWSLGPEPFKEAHFATFPTEIPRRAIVAGCPPHGVVLDPFLGSGTTALVADRLQRDCIGIELNPAYADMAERRIRGDAPMFAEVIE